MAGSFLRQSTASQSRATPPFLDDTDFKTAETALTIANTDVKLVVNGGASVDKNSGGGTHRANGIYSLTFDATDTATVGEMEVSIKVTGALPVFMKFWVLEEAVYDALFAASAPGYLQPTVAGRTLDVSTGGEAGIDWANVGSQSTSVNLSATTTNLCNTITTYTGNTVQTGDAFSRIGAAGAGLTALGDTRIANLDATVSSRGTSTLTQTQVTGGAYSIQSASCVLGDARIANLDATVSSRGTSTLTQTQVTGGAYTIQSSSCVLGDVRIANLDTTVSSRGTSTLTQTQVTGGAYALNHASFSFNSALDFTTTQKAATIARCTLVDTVTSTAAIAAGGITAASFASNALTSTKGDTTYYASIAQAVWQLTSTTAFGTVGSVGYELDGYLSNIETLVSDIGSVIHKYETVYYVSASSGNDSDSGLTSSAAKLTLTAAKTAAASGSLIIVMPGAYNEKNLLKTGVDWYFARGAIVNYTGSGTGGMFDDSSLGANGAVVCRVSGYGRFIHATSNGSTNAPVLRVANASSRIYFDGLDILNTSPLASAPYGISHEAGDLQVKMIGPISSTNGGSVLALSSGRFVCEADSYYGGVAVQGASAYIKGRKATTASGYVLSATGAPPDVLFEIETVYGPRAIYLDLDSDSYSVTLIAKHVEGTDSAQPPVECDNAGTLYIVGAYIVGSLNSAGVVDAVSGTIHLRDCVIRNLGSGYDISVNGVCSVVNCDYRRSRIFGTVTEAPPADYVTSVYGVTNQLSRSANTIVLGTVTTGSSTTSIPTSSLSPSATVADQYKGRIVIFDKNTTTTALRGQATDITASTSGGVLTVTALTTAPSSGDTFVIV